MVSTGKLADTSSAFTNCFRTSNLRHTRTVSEQAHEDVWIQSKNNYHTLVRAGYTNNYTDQEQVSCLNTYTALVQFGTARVRSSRVGQGLDNSGRVGTGLVSAGTGMVGTGTRIQHGQGKDG
ncbi:MAG: hypothetical protein LBI63_01860 [Candidatus Ancillula sp.]|nr:hypothetical protein [Candidatus Ancillula sp.]